MKKAAVISLILAMALSLGACGGDSSDTASNSQNAEASSTLQTEGAGSAETAAGGNITVAAGGNMTVAAGGNMTAAGGNATESRKPSLPPVLDPPSMKTGYQPETEDQKYAREIAGIYLLTDLKDTLSDETGDKAKEFGAEGNPMYLEFFSNGTMRETVFGDPMGGLWDKEYLTLGSDRIPYEFKGDHVTVTSDHMSLTFTRTTEEELDMLLDAGKDTGTSANGTEAAEEAAKGTEEETDETAAGGSADEIAEDSEGDSEEEAPEKKVREERIIKLGTDDSEEGAQGETGIGDALETGTGDGSEAGIGEASEVGAGEGLEAGVGEELETGIEDGSETETGMGEGLETENGDGSENGTEGLTSEEDVSGNNADGTGEDAAAAAQQMEEYIITDDLCSMVATGYDFSDPRGFVIHVRCENYSIYNLAFNIQFGVVNNVMFEPGTPEGGDYWTCEVEPQSTLETDMVFSAEKAAEYGITSFDYVMMQLWVRNMDNWMDSPIYTGDKELYPTDNVTASGEGIQNVERRSAPGEQKIAEENKFNFTILGSEVRPNGDFVLKACIENKTWQNLTFTWDDVYVNGTLLDPFWAVETLPGTICYDEIVFTANDLVEKGVSAVSDVTFTMSAVDSKDWLSYAIYTETSTYRA